MSCSSQCCWCWLHPWLREDVIQVSSALWDLGEIEAVLTPCFWWVYFSVSCSVHWRLSPFHVWVGIYCGGELFSLTYLPVWSHGFLFYSVSCNTLIFFCCSCWSCPRFGWWKPLQAADWFLYKLCHFSMSSSFLEHFLNFQQVICLLEVIFLLVWNKFSPLRNTDAIFSFPEHHSNISSQSCCLRMWLEASLS